MPSTDAPPPPSPPDSDPGDETPDEPRPPSEDEIVMSYREMMLVELGFNQNQAAAIAERGVSWHEADGLLKAGCDHLTAVDLLT